MTKSVTAKWLQEGNYGGPSAVYICVKQGHETQGNIKRLRNDQLKQEIQRAVRGLFVEFLNTTKNARVTRATIYNKLLCCNPEALVRIRWEPIHWPTKQEDSNTTQTGKYQNLAYQKKAGETPHTLHKRSQENNPEGNKCTGTMPLKLLPEDFGKAEEGMKDEIKQQNRPSKKQRERL